LADLAGHTGTVRALDWSPDGEILVSVGEDATVRLWRFEGAGASPGTCLGHSGAVVAVCWGPAGRWLASGSLDGAVCVWNPEFATELLLLDGHDGGVLGIDVSPDGTRIASASLDGTVRIWDVADLPGPRQRRDSPTRLDAWAARQAATVGRRAPDRRPTRLGCRTCRERPGPV
jgi:WD40 repeat protein